MNTNNMLRISFMMTFAFLLSSCSLFKKVPNKNDNKKGLEDIGTLSLDRIAKEQTVDQTKDILTTISSDEFEGRKPGKQGFELSVNYVEDFLEESNIAPFFGNSYKDTFMYNGITSYNVVGLIGERNTEEYILIGAHLDHIGKSRSTVDSIYNGANDNASGVTAVLQISKELAKYKFEKSIIVVLFSAEEDHLIGSKHLASRLMNDSINLSYVLNFEMIGKTLTRGENQVYITGHNKSNLAKEMNEVMDENFVEFLPAEIRYQLFSRSDNFPFYAEYRIPSHTISTFDFKNYKHYHKESDEIDELDISNMNKIINSSTYIIAQFLMNDTVLEMQNK